MFESIRQIFILGTKSKKIWIIPLVLFLIIIALLVISAQISPLPVFKLHILWFVNIGLVFHAFEMAALAKSSIAAIFLYLHTDRSDHD